MCPGREAGGEFCRALQLHQQVPAAPEVVAEVADDVGPAELKVRARRDGDGVLAGRVDEDQGQAGRAPVIGRDAAFRQSFGEQHSARLIAERVGAEPGDEQDVGAEPPRADGLIRALPAGTVLEAAADDCLAGGRQPGAVHAQPGVIRAHHYQLSHLSSSWPAMSRAGTSPGLRRARKPGHHPGTGLRGSPGHYPGSGVRRELARSTSSARSTTRRGGNFSPAIRRSRSSAAIRPIS